MKLEIVDTTWTMVEPFVTAAEVTREIHVLTVTVTDGDARGRAETLGVDYLGEDAASLRAQLEGVRNEVEAGMDRQRLQALLPPGGARNGLDCALWDLECKRSGQRAWEQLQMPMAPVRTVFTLALGSAAAMADKARQCADMPHLKLKLDSRDTADKIVAIRQARPDARIVIDANGSWTPALMDELADMLAANRIFLLEQPLAMGQDGYLADLDYPVPVCADESCQSSRDLEALANRYQAINIKLDKCGGLTDALAILAWCRAHGKKVMVGNMLGSSLAMAPAMVVAASADLADLDGPLWQTRDVDPPIPFRGTLMTPPPRALWG